MNRPVVRIAAQVASELNVNDLTRMIVIIARKECRELIRDGRFRWATVVLTVLLAAALIDGWKRYTDARHNHLAMQEAERERWLNQGNKNPHSAAHQGLFVFRPQLAIAALDPGIDPYVGRAVHLEAHAQRLFRYRPADDADISRRLGELTAATALQKLIPFLIILLAFGAFAAERERGTLRQVLSMGVTPRAVAIGKAIGLMAPLAALLIPASLAASVVLFLGSGMEMSAQLPRILVMAGSYLAWFATIVAVTLWISARASTSRQALSVLLGLWFVACVLMPPLATGVAQRIHSAPAALDFAAALREGKMTLPIWYEQLGGVERRLFAQHGAKNVDDLPVSATGIAMVEEEDDFNRVQEHHFGRLYQAHRDQNRFYQWAGLLAPSIALHSLSMGLAGSDFEQHADFAMEAERYRRNLVQTMNRDLITNDFERNRTAVQFPGIVAKSYQPGRELWEKVPPFTYSFFDLRRVMTTYLVSLLSLGFWLVLAIAAAARATSRLEV